MRYIDVSVPFADAHHLVDEYRVCGSAAAANDDLILACRYYSAALYIEFTSGRLRWTVINEITDRMKLARDKHIAITLSKDRKPKTRKQLRHRVEL